MENKPSLDLFIGDEKLGAGYIYESVSGDVRLSYGVIPHPLRQSHYIQVQAGRRLDGWCYFEIREFDRFPLNSPLREELRTEPYRIEISKERFSRLLLKAS